MVTIAEPLGVDDAGPRESRPPSRRVISSAARTRRFRRWLSRSLLAVPAVYLLGAFVLGSVLPYVDDEAAATLAAGRRHRDRARHPDLHRHRHDRLHRAGDRGRPGGGPVRGRAVLAAPRALVPARSPGEARDRIVPRLLALLPRRAAEPRPHRRRLRPGHHAERRPRPDPRRQRALPGAAPARHRPAAAAGHLPRPRPRGAHRRRGRLPAPPGGDRRRRARATPGSPAWAGSWRPPLPRA